MTAASRQAFIGVCFATLVAFAAGLTEIERECDRVPCVAEQFSEVSLSCGNGGETITAVYFASYGTPVGTCPNVTNSPLRRDDFNFSAVSGCDLSISLDIVKSKCIGEASCKFDIIDAIDGETDGLGSCASTPYFSVAVECADEFNIFGIFAQLVIALIGFALGCTVTIDGFKETISLHGRAVLIGWACQFGFMPLVAYLYIVMFDVKDLVALGVILCGSVPGGTTSNLMTYYSNGNVALSIVMSVASTVCAMFMLPLLLYVYGTVALEFEGDVAVPFLDIFITLLVVIIPVSIGVWIRMKSEKWAKRCEVVGSVLGLFFLLAALITGIVDNPDLFNPSLYQKTWIGAAFFQPIGAALGFGIGKFVNLTGPELRAVTLETGIQNYTIAIAVATLSFTGCERSVVLTFILAASFWYIVNSAWLTGLLRYHSTFDSPEDQKEAKETHVNPEIL